jgi:hypothetical protein
MLVATEVEKFASLPSADANSFNVSRAAGAAATRLDTEVSTYPFVAASVDTVGAPRFVTLFEPIFNAPLMVSPAEATVVEST